MFSFELGRISKKTVCNEHRDVVNPSVSRSCGKENPAIFSSNSLEGFNPRSRSNKSLFVEDKELVLKILIFRNVVPRINSNSSRNREISFGGDSKFDSLRFPIERVSFFRGCDDDDIYIISIRVRRFFFLVVSKGRECLPSSYSPPQNLPVSQILDRFLLMRK